MHVSYKNKNTYMANSHGSILRNEPYKLRAFAEGEKI